jgi:L-seryl-tRNA(Ser) seleniumtransferase
MVKAVRAQEKGIGRAMKASKEALAGVQAAVAQRMQIDAAAWRQEQDRKVALLVGLMQQSKIPGVTADAAPDPTGLPFSRVRLQIDTAAAGIDATRLTQVLRQGKPSIWTMDHEAVNGVVWLELIALRDDEIHAIHIALNDTIAKRGGRSHA